MAGMFFSLSSILEVQKYNYFLEFQIPNSKFQTNSKIPNYLKSPYFKSRYLYGLIHF